MVYGIAPNWARNRADCTCRLHNRRMRSLHGSGGAVVHRGARTAFCGIVCYSTTRNRHIALCGLLNAAYGHNSMRIALALVAVWFTLLGALGGYVVGASRPAARRSPALRRSKPRLILRHGMANEPASAELPAAICMARRWRSIRLVPGLSSTSRATKPYAAF